MARLTRAESHARTRQRLLEAAAQVFARRGFAGASVEEVAEEAGFSKGAVYSNFSDKQDLLASLMEWHCEEQLAQIRSLLAQPMPFEDRIDQVAAAYFAPSEGEEREGWCLRFVELWLQAMREPSLRPRMAQLNEATRRAVAEMIEREAERRGETLAQPADELAEAVLGVGDGLMMRYLIAPSERSLSAYRSTLHALFAAAVRVPEQGGITGAQADGT